MKTTGSRCFNNNTTADRITYILLFLCDIFHYLLIFSVILTDTKIGKNAMKIK